MINYSESDRPTPKHERVKFTIFFSRLIDAGVVTSQQDLARKLNLGPTAVAHVRKREREVEQKMRASGGWVPKSWTLSLEKFGYSREWMVHGIGPQMHGLKTQVASSKEYISVPFARNTVDESGELQLLVDETSRRLAFLNAWISTKGNPNMMVALVVGDDEATPKICRDSTVLVDTDQKGFEDGRYFAVAIMGSIVIRKIQISLDGFTLLGAGQTFIPKDKLSEVKVIGQAIWVGNEL